MLDSRAAWVRLGLLLLVSSTGGVGMWSVVVTLPAVHTEFGVARAGAALPCTLTMLGFAAGGVVMRRASDRFGIVRVATAADVMLAAGYALASRTHDLLSYALVDGVLIGMLGSGALFGPVMADASLWFRCRRGLAVAIAAAGNYVAGAVWPPIRGRSDAVLRLAGDRARHRRGHAAQHSTAGLAAARTVSCAPNHCRRQCCGGHVASATGAVAVRSACAARGRGPWLLRCDRDAAGAHRRLLRRPRPRPGTRGGDAVAHARARGCQSCRVRLGRRPHRRLSAAWA